MLHFILDTWTACLHLLLDASVYILFGLVVAGLIRVFLNPATVGRHLGAGRITSVFKASLVGIPVPL
jgi:uncharacterized membrane protein YraQ (UPF0718 family)